MGKKEQIEKAPKSILEEIMEDSFQKLEDNENFDSKLILELQRLTSEGNLQNDMLLISILRGESP